MFLFSPAPSQLYRVIQVIKVDLDINHTSFTEPAVALFCCVIQLLIVGKWFWLGDNYKYIKDLC